MSAAGVGPGALFGGRYQIEEELGRGGMGCVYRATDIKLRRPVAVKVLEFLNDIPEAHARFRREARIGAILTHDNLVATYDFGEEEGHHFLVLELVEGRSLGEFLEESVPLEVHAATQIIVQIASALREAHARGLVHRDLKPGNVIVVSDSPVRCKVIDFGMAVAIDDSLGPGVGRLTQDGIVAGTPPYMSPEQLRGEPPQPASDVYALGCLAHELFTGSPPYEFEGLGGIAVHHMSGSIPNIARDDVPALVKELVTRCLAKAGHQRPSMAQVVSRLEHLDSRQAFLERRGSAPKRTEYWDAEDTNDMSWPAIIGDDELVRDDLVAHASALSEEFLIALRAAGLAPIEESKAPPGTVVVALGVSIERVEELAHRSLIVITDSPATDMSRIAALLRAGAQEVVPAPASPESLITKIRRAQRVHARMKARQ